MRCRVLTALTLAALVGCGKTETATNAPPPKADTKLPPEVEFDPVTAAKKYEAAKKSARR